MAPTDVHPARAVTVAQQRAVPSTTSGRARRHLTDACSLLVRSRDLSLILGPNSLAHSTPATRGCHALPSPAIERHPATVHM